MPKGQRSAERPLDSGRGASSRFDEITIAASGAEVRRALEWLEAACRRCEVPQSQRERLALCLHEVLANVLAHGGGSALEAPIGIAFEMLAEPGGVSAGVTVSDAGTAFNPLSVPQKTLPKTLDEASPGGLGLVMIRRSADGLDYRREDGRNHFTFSARWSA